MTSPTRDSPRKRALILDTAATLFARHGFQGTGLSMIAGSAGVAIGSISHYFGDKRALASAAHDHLSRQLVAVIEQALTRCGPDVPKAIRSMLSAYLEWAALHPQQLRFLFLSGAPVAGSDQFSVEETRARLAPALRTWSEPLIRERKIVPLTAAQLYAVMLAPAVSATLDPDGAVARADVDLLDILARSALAAVLPTGPKRDCSAPANRRRPGAAKRGGQSNDLFTGRREGE